MDKFNFFLEADDEDEDKKDSKDTDFDDDLDDNDYLGDSDESSSDESDFDDNDEKDDNFSSDNEETDSSLDDNDYLGDSDESSSDDVVGGIGEEGDSDPSKILKCVYAACVITHNMEHIHFHAVGKHFDKIHDIADNWAHTIKYSVDRLAELALENKSAKLDNLCNAHQYVSEISLETEDKYDYEAALTAINANLRHMITCLESALEEKDNSYMRDLLDSLKKESNYSMERRLSVSESFSFDIK